MEYKCKNCGEILSHPQGFCSNCGAKTTIKSNKKFTCPLCGNMVDYNSDFCGECGFKLTKDLNYVIRELQSKTCPHCGSKNNMDSEFCGNCGNNIPMTSELEIITCPNCKKDVRDDINFCRFCGHNFITNKKLLFRKKAVFPIQYCQNCGNKISNSSVSSFCEECGTAIPSNITNHEQQQLKFINNFIVPLSKEYNVNFRKITLSQYFNLTHIQESHIIYLIMKKIEYGKDNDDLISYFKEILEETKKNYENLELAIINRVKHFLIKSFNENGIAISGVFAIKNDYYETVETPVIENKHSGFTKGVATLGFGLVGLAATSGVKQTIDTKKILNKGNYSHIQVVFSSKYIVVKSYIDDSKYNLFNSDKGNLNKTVIYWNDVNSIDRENYLILNSGETFRIPTLDLTVRIENEIDYICGVDDNRINHENNEKYQSKVYSAVSNVVPKLIKETIENNKKTNINNNQPSMKSNINQQKENDNNENNMLKSETESLEKIIDLYKAGLLTDEEFIAMKQKVFNNPSETKQNYCKNCGKKLTDNSKFCSYCGTKIE
jgi:predicted amidophosphoribosyltransferase